MYKKSEIETVSFQTLIQMVELPAFQRSEDEAHTKDICNFELKHMKDYGYFLFPGVISLGINGTRKPIVLDGQHRISAIHKILVQYPKFANETVNVIKIYGNEDYHFDIYNRINCNKKVDLVWARNTTEVIHRTIDQLKKDFKDFTKTTAPRPQKPNINLTQLTQALIQTKIVETLGIIEPKDLYEKLMELNRWYGACSKKDFDQWGISYEQGKEEKQGKKFYLGLYNHDFEFIRRLILKYRDGVDYNEQDHHVMTYSKEDKQKESKYFDQASMNGQLDVVCECCGNGLTKKNFKCGLKKSFYQGGEREVGNMALICENCFLEMGRQNVQDLMNEKKKSSESKQEVDLIML